MSLIAFAFFLISSQLHQHFTMLESCRRDTGASTSSRCSTAGTTRCKYCKVFWSWIRFTYYNSLKSDRMTAFVANKNEWTWHLVSLWYVAASGEKTPVPRSASILRGFALLTSGSSKKPTLVRLLVTNFYDRNCLIELINILFRG